MCQLFATSHDETTVAAPLAAFRFKRQKLKSLKSQSESGHAKARSRTRPNSSVAAWQADSSYLRPSEEKTEGHLSSCFMRQLFKVLQNQTSSSGLHQQVKIKGRYDALTAAVFMSR